MYEIFPLLNQLGVLAAEKTATASLTKQLADLKAATDAATASLTKQLADLKTATDGALAASAKQLADLKTATDATVADLTKKLAAAIASGASPAYLAYLKQCREEACQRIASMESQKAFWVKKLAGIPSE